MSAEGDGSAINAGAGGGRGGLRYGTTGVTCLLPVGDAEARTPEALARWLEAGDGLLRAAVPLVIFAQRGAAAEAVAARRRALGLEALTRVVPTTLEELPFARWAPVIERNRAAYWPTRDARAPRDLHVVHNARFAFVEAASHWNPFGTTHFAQVDFNLLAKRPNGSEHYTGPDARDKLAAIFRAPRRGCTVLLLEHWRPEAFDDLAAFFSTYRYQVAGLFWTIEGGALAERVLRRATEVAEDFVRRGYGHGDEHALARTADLLPEDFEYSLGDYEDALENYHRPTANLERARGIVAAAEGSRRHAQLLAYIRSTMMTMEREEKM